MLSKVSKLEQELQKQRESSAEKLRKMEEKCEAATYEADLKRQKLSLLVLPGKMIMLVFVFLFYHQSYLSFKIRMLSEAFAWEINFSTIYIPIVFLYLPFILHYAFFYYSLISFTLLLYCKFLKAKIICGLF